MVLGEGRGFEVAQVPQQSLNAEVGPERQLMIGSLELCFQTFALISNVANCFVSDIAPKFPHALTNLIDAQQSIDPESSQSSQRRKFIQDFRQDDSTARHVCSDSLPVGALFIGEIPRPSLSPHGSAKYINCTTNPFAALSVPGSHPTPGPPGSHCPSVVQARLGPGRLHHCMRTIGAAEAALAALVHRTQAPPHPRPSGPEGRKGGGCASQATAGVLISEIF